MSAVSTLVEPAYRYCPDYHQTFGAEVADLGVLAGFAPDPEQRLGLDMLFGVDRRGKSTAFEFAAVCCRQNMKTGLFKLAALGWLFITDQPLIVWSAHEFNTAQEAHRDMANLIEGSAYLSRRLKQVYNGAADKSIELMSGQRLVFKARTKTGGRGLSAPKVVLDEAFALRPAHMGALLPTLSVQPDPQVVYGSSAGLADSDVLRGIRDRGRKGRGRLAYLEWCAETGGCEQERCDHDVGTPSCALDRVENWQAANPLLGRTRENGTGLTVEYVRAEREALPPLEFARERLGWWDEPGASEIFGPGKWKDCAADPPTGLPLIALGVAVTVNLSHAAIVAAGRDGDTVVVKPLQHGPGTSWVLERLAALQRAHPDAMVVVDSRGPGATLIPQMMAADLRVHMTSTSEVLDGCAQFFELVTTGRLSHSNYAELNAAVNGATTRMVGDRWAWGRRTSSEDISPLEAATLAAWWAHRPDDRPSLSPPPVAVSGTSRLHPMRTQGF